MEAIAALERAEYRFDRTALERKLVVSCDLGGRQRLMPVAATHDAVLEATAGQFGVQVRRVKAAIGKDFADLRQKIGRNRDLLHIGWRQLPGIDRRRTRINGDVGFVAKAESTALVVGAEPRIGIRRAHLVFIHARPPRGAGDKVASISVPCLTVTLLELLNVSVAPPMLSMTALPPLLELANRMAPPASLMRLVVAAPDDRPAPSC